MPAHGILAPWDTGAVESGNTYQKANPNRKVSLPSGNVQLEYCESGISDNCEKAPAVY